MGEFKGKTLLVTGGTGSFGHAVATRFLSSDISEIRVFSRDEKKQDDMRRQFGDAKLKFYLGDVRDAESITDAMAGAHYVFHAAALKQVPSCEFHPLEAIKTNILGADNVMNSAIRHGVLKTIVLSTDKSVYPINAMGLSKALMEKVMLAKARLLEGSTSILCGTRYGNVMASRGSVIPLFVEQILSRNPITITDPGMTRFMMTLEDAVELVLHAFAKGQHGDIFVQKAPAATIGDLAGTLMKIFKVKLPVKNIGVRHGEKKHEVLLNAGEMARAEDQGRYFRIASEVSDLNHRKFMTKGDKRLSKEGVYSSETTELLTTKKLEAMLLQLPYIRQAMDSGKA